MNILLTCILAANLGLFVIIGLFLLRVRKVSKEIRSFLNPVKDGEASPLSNTLQIFADMVGRSVAATAKAVLMGKASVAARQENAEQVEAGIAGLGNSPLAALASLPMVQKTLKKNPQLLDIAMQLMNRGSGVGPPPGGNNHNGEAQAKFKL